MSNDIKGTPCFLPLVCLRPVFREAGKHRPERPGCAREDFDSFGHIEVHAGVLRLVDIHTSAFDVRLFDIRYFFWSVIKKMSNTQRRISNFEVCESTLLHSTFGCSTFDIVFLTCDKRKHRTPNAEWQSVSQFEITTPITIPAATPPKPHKSFSRFRPRCSASMISLASPRSLFVSPISRFSVSMD